MSMPNVTDLIPHRGRYLLLDRLTEIGPTHAVAEGHFLPEDVEGHFPGQPIVPGVLLLEGLAQTMACLSQHLDHGTGAKPLLAGFDKVRFRAPVFPPATVTYSVKLTEQRFGLTQGSGTVFINGKRAVTAKLTGAFLPEDAQ